MEYLVRSCLVISLLTAWLTGCAAYHAEVADPSPTLQKSAEPKSEKERLEGLSLGPIPERPWRFHRFPILAWWAPPGTATEEDFLAYKRAGFTLYPLNPDDGYEGGLQKAGDAGLKILVFRNTQGFGLPDQKVHFPENDKRVVGWITKDEPGSPEEVIHSIRETHRLMKQDPTRRAFFNLLPPHAQPAPGTEELARIALRNGLPILSYDHYVMMGDGTTATDEHFANLELFRGLSLEYDVPFWAFALTIKHGPYRRPSESDVRWKQFTNLAYGAKGLWYFTYWGPTDWKRWDNKAIVDPKDGSKTDLYRVVKEINHAVLDAGDVLLGLRSVDVVHLHPPAGCHPFVPGQYWIIGLDAEDALVGFFLDRKGRRYALVVNNRHGGDLTADQAAEEITLTFSPDVHSVEALSWLDGTKGSLKLDGQKTRLRVGGGTGVLLRAN